MKGFLYDVARGTAVAISVGIVLHLARRAALSYGMKLPSTYNPALPGAMIRDTAPATVADLVGLALAGGGSKKEAVAPTVGAPVSGVPTASASHDTESNLTRERA